MSGTAGGGAPRGETGTTLTGYASDETRTLDHCTRVRSKSQRVGVSEVSAPGKSTRRPSDTSRGTPTMHVDGRRWNTTTQRQWQT
eukprot:6082031-Prymnesium_polylepis.1